MQTYSSVAYVASAVMLATAGRVYGVAVAIQAPGSYWLTILDAAAIPADGTDITTASYKRVALMRVTTTAADQVVDVNFEIAGFPSDSGVRLAAGCVVLLSSTAPTSITGVASGMWINLGRFG